MTKLVALAAVAAGAVLAPADGARDDMVQVGPGSFVPLYTDDDAPAAALVRGFLLDRAPVTNADMLAFVRAAPKWRKASAPRLFADERYLSHWESATSPGANAPPKAPVVFVSWFAAKAYCEHRGKRLPTEAEWELAASAGERSKDGRSEPGFTEKILAWYATPTPKRLADVGQRAPNAWGVHDLHGLTWEWVFDYSSSFAPGDSRKDDDDNPTGICGAGAANASEKSDYAAFMRAAFRSSLEAAYTAGSLGFRCAKDLEEKRP